MGAHPGAPIGRALVIGPTRLAEVEVFRAIFQADTQPNEEIPVHRRANGPVPVFFLGAESVGAIHRDVLGVPELVGGRALEFRGAETHEAVAETETGGLPGVSLDVRGAATAVD